MSSAMASQTGYDAVVNVKVLYGGITRRARMNLREMVPRVLEDQIRMFLHIPADVHMTIERYSDSAATYVLLEPGNMAVYKQLYRAAKAKSKLKLRVSTSAQQAKIVPKPASVEDETDADAASTKPPPTHVENVPAKNPSPITSSPMASVSDPREPMTATSRALPVRQPNSSTKCAPVRQGNVVIKPGETEYDAILRTIREGNVRAAEETRLPNDAIKQATNGNPVSVSSPASVPSDNGRDNIKLSKNLAPTKCYDEVLGNEEERQWARAARSANAQFAVCCNHCEKQASGAHYHCSTCDDGDFDLCQTCVDQGVTCHSNEHWLIKRSIQNGQVVNSTTERIAPKKKSIVQAQNEQPSFLNHIPTFGQDGTQRKEDESSESNMALPGPDDISHFLYYSLAKLHPDVRTFAPEETKPTPSRQPKEKPVALPGNMVTSALMRTCNSCVEEWPSRACVHCTTCEDFDLCQDCFAQGSHGHHPKHGFIPAFDGTYLPDQVKAKLGPGRNQMHHAICDGCDKYINGVRHKCLDCPDWDYCSDCIVNAEFIHAKHRFVPVYEPLKEPVQCVASQPVHHGICCDGPLCSFTGSSGKVYPTYIRGIRYKCAVCHDLDFCGNCEASPANDHNKTHPLIKFKTPVRHVSVTTTGEHKNGTKMPPMGDRDSVESRAIEVVPTPETNAVHAAQTVVNVKPATPKEEVVEPKDPEIKQTEDTQEEESAKTQPDISQQMDLQAVFLKDTIADGTIMPPNHVFEQTWTLRNEGAVAWPAGCAVKFVGGDYMGHVDSAHPAGISELVSASESTVCYSALAPGQEFSFTVLLRTPARPGKMISYWRLTTQDGFKFGHRLWCEINVRHVAVTPVTPQDLLKAPAAEKSDSETKVEPKKGTQTTMIFPKLEKESPVSSIHEATQHVAGSEVEKANENDEFDDCAEEDDWNPSDGGFLTDEEYDILDASDEEFLEQQEKKLQQL